VKKIAARVSAGCLAALLGGARPAGAVDVLTLRYDNTRLGVNARESVLTPANVNSLLFGKLFSQEVDGAVYAQPLLLSGVSVAGRGIHDVVFVATEHDSVYAFDADDASGDNASPLWHVSFLISESPGVTVSSVSSQDVSCADLSPEIGITGTPVIDPSTGTLYVVAKTKEVISSGTTYVQRLHALDVSTGAEKFSGPVILQASVPGLGQGSSEGQVAFDPLKANNRPALLLVNGVVYLAFASHCDVGPYHGWIFGYDATTLERRAVVCTTPNAGLGGVWMGGDGPSTDSSGHIFLATGNGGYDLHLGGNDIGESVLKFNAGDLSLADSFAPHNQEQLSSVDADLGSGGVILLPDQPTWPRPHLMVAEGKEGVLYVIDRDDMGGYDPNGDHCLQSVPISSLPAFHTPAFYNDTLYTGFSFDRIRALPLAGGVLSPNPSSYTAMGFPFPGPSPVVSANGSASGILWVLGFGDAATLYAFDASDLSVELYDSAQAPGGRDQPGAAVKFAQPAVANGKVYVGTQTNVTVFGLFGRAGAQPLPTVPPAELSGR
jgi:hypothetical protein